MVKHSQLLGHVSTEKTMFLVFKMGIYFSNGSLALYIKAMYNKRYCVLVSTQALAYNRDVPSYNVPRSLHIEEMHLGIMYTGPCI